MLVKEYARGVANASQKRAGQWPTAWGRSRFISHEMRAAQRASTKDAAVDFASLAYARDKQGRATR